jgi:hypothetical protein
MLETVLCVLGTEIAERWDECGVVGCALELVTSLGGTSAVIVARTEDIVFLDIFCCCNIPLSIGIDCTLVRRDCHAGGSWDSR